MLRLNRLGQAFAIAVVALIVGNCEISRVVAPLTERSLSVVAGNEQMGLVSETLPEQLQVRVQDSNGVPLAGVAVDWNAASGAGSVSPATSVSDNDGIASTSWTLGATPGPQTVSAQVADVPAMTFSATAIEATSEPAVERLAITPAADTLDYLGATTTFGVEAFDANEQPLSGVTIRWSSVNTSVASVDSEGEVLAKATGTALIVARAICCDRADTVGLVVRQVVSAVSISPASTTVDVGGTDTLTASAQDAGGNTVPNVTIAWSSTNEGIATASSTGVVRGMTAGSAKIIAATAGRADSVAVHVLAPTSSGEWDRVVSNVTFESDVVVPDGEKWLIGPNVSVRGNLRTVGGTIGMRPGSSLKLLGANPDEYVGGGMTFGPGFEKDIGVWIGPQGALDIQCTPKTGWNRTGVDGTWSATDEYWISPTDMGDEKARRWSPGEPIPRVQIPSAYHDRLAWVPADWKANGIPAEVMNVTRDCVIEGPGHIHIHSGRAQRIEYVQLRGLGVSTQASQGAVLGRYALHLHMSGDGTRGTIIRGVAAVESKGVVFVPHASHGITMIDNVSVNSWNSGFWWDKGAEHSTRDLSVDRLIVSGGEMPDEINGHRFVGIQLPAGENISMHNSAVSGIAGTSDSGGFGWLIPNDTDALWDFQNNIAHNNSGAGVRFWTNSDNPHEVMTTISYRNDFGTFNGAYKNAVSFIDMLLLENESHAGMHDTSADIRTDGEPSRFERVIFHSLEGAAVESQGRKLAAVAYREYIDCVLDPGPGQPKVRVNNGGNPWLAKFIRCNLHPDDVSFDLSDANDMEGTHIIIENADGSSWEIRVTNGTKVVTQK